MTRNGNNKETFVQLWQELERTRVRFALQGKMFCIRRVMQEWFPNGIQPRNPNRPFLPFDDACYMVCFKARYYGYDLLPNPAVDPEPCRNFLRALMQVKG